METQEFEHYFRLCMPRKITSDEARELLHAVNDNADVEADNEDVVMVYHEANNLHCYDVRLARDITGEQGDDILYDLEELFPNDDFECESSMDTVSEQQYLNRAVMEQLARTII